MPPSHASVLGKVFPPSALDRLRQANLSGPGRYSQRYYLRAQLLDPVAPLRPYYAAYRRAWVRYLDAAQKGGLLDDNELLGNLRSLDHDAFRAAMHECMVCWFFRNRERATVLPKPAGRRRRTLDLKVRKGSQTLFVEVKSPHVPLRGTRFAGDDTAAIRKAIESSGAQFATGVCNVLVVAPVFRTKVYSSREQLIQAVAVTEGFSIPVEPMLRDEMSAVEPTFFQTGKLAAPRRGPAGQWKTDFTRIGAVVTIEEYLREGSQRPEVGHLVLVAHNPFASVRLSEATLSSYPQWVCRDGIAYWTDQKD